MKKIWMEAFYSLLCKELYSKRDIETIECLLLILQFDNCLENTRLKLPYKVYIDKNSIRINYISDLLRTGKPIDIVYNGYILYNGYDLSEFDKCFKLLNRYKKFSNEEIKKTAFDIIQNEKLNQKCFVHQKYKNRWNRIYARLTRNRHKSVILTYIRIIIGIFSFTSLFCSCIGYILIYILNNKNISLNRLHIVILIAIVSMSIYIGWSIMWSLPTKFEIENGYLDNDGNE